MKNSKVSIIVPCYNQAQFLDEALQSVLDQTYQDWECIIVNDGSPDNTEEVAEKWLEKNSRFVYIKKENGGLSSARNAGLEIALGDYIQFLDSDDFLVRTKLELSLRHIDLEKSKDVQVAISNFRMFVDNPQKTSAPYCNLNNHLFNFESLLYQWDESFSIPIHCGLFKSSLFKSFRFPEELKSKEDWVMWVSLFRGDCEAVFIDKPLALYRNNPDSMTKSKNMLPDFIRACDYFSNYLHKNEFQKLSLLLISRYCKSNQDLNYRLIATKKSNTHQTGLLIKKFLKAVGALRVSKRLFPFFLKFKAK